MKRKIIVVLAGTLIIGSVCIFGSGCSQMRSKAEGVQTQVVQNEGFQITTKEIKLNEKYITADMKVPVISKLTNKDTEDKINKILEKNINDFVDMKVGWAKEAYNKDEENYSSEKIVSNYNVTYKNENIVSLWVESKADNDKNIAYSLKDSYTFDVGTGKTIDMDRFFDEDEDYKEVIKNYMVQKLKSEKKDIYIFKSNIDKSEFYLKENSIVVYFDLYDNDLEKMKTMEFQIPFKNFKKGVNTDIKSNPCAVNIQTKEIAESNEYFEADINIPVLVGLKDEKVQQKINEMFETQAIEFKDSIKSAAKGAFEDSKKYKYEMHSYNATLIFEEKKNEEDMLSITLMYGDYKGGAHGSQDNITYNIDLKTGDMIELKDLFNEGYDYKKEINKKIKEQIYELAEETKEKGLAEGEKLENIYIKYQAFEGIRDNHSFYLKDDKLGIYFASYEIASYAEGRPTFEINLSDLEDGLKEEYKN